MRMKSLPRFGIKIIVCYEDRRQPDFKQFSLDKDLKVDVGLIDSDESMESICTQICEMLPDDLYSNIRFL